MRRSTRPKHLPPPTAAAPAAKTSAAVPQPHFNDDGTFRLRRSNGQTINGTCRDLTYRLSRRLITTSPDNWYADCNENGFPHTLRIYRLGDDKKTPVGVFSHTYLPQQSRWRHNNPTQKPTATLTPSLPTITLPTFKLLSPFFAFLYRLLGGNRKQFAALGKFRPSRPLNLGPKGEHEFTKDLFTPLTIRDDGYIFIDGKPYTQAQKIDTWSKNRRVRYFRSRGRYQKLYILRTTTKGELIPIVLNYQHGLWWIWDRVGPGSLSDDRPIVAARAAYTFQVIVWIWFILFIVGAIFKSK